MGNISKLTPILYDKGETNFNHNGLGKLTKLLANEIDEVLNGEFEAFFEYPANGHLADKIDNEMFIKAKPNKKDEPHVFKIYDYELDTFTQTYLIYARSKNVEDLRNNVILDVNVRGLAPTQAWNLAKNNALDPVVTTFYSDITTTSSVHWKRRSLLSTIAGQEGSMIQYWGGEIKHGIDRISLFRRRGQDNVTTVRHGKNLDGLKSTYSTKGLVTAIVPYYVKDDGNAIYGDVVESEYINNYPSTYYDIIEYNDEDLGLNSEDEPDNKDILNALNSKASRWFDEHPEKDLPSINMEIALEDISQTKEYENFKDFEQIEIGDTITVYSKKFDLNINAKVRRVVYNGLTDKNELVEVGTARRSLYDDVRDEFKKVETELQEGIDHAMTSANGKNTNYHGTADPNEIGLVGQNNDNYFRTNGQFKELWIYRDGMWHLEVGDLTGEQIRAEVEQAQVDIEEAKQTADEAVNQIDTAVANAGFSSLTDLTASLDGRTTALTANVDSITSIVTDHQDRISTVEQTAEGLQTTVAGKADQSQVTQLADLYNIAIGRLNDLGNPNLIVFSDLENGTFNASDGSPTITSRSNRLRTMNFIEREVNEDFVFSLQGTTFGIQINIYQYDADKNYISNVGFKDFENNEMSYIPNPDTRYFKLLIRFKNGQDINASHITQAKLKLESGNQVTDYDTSYTQQAQISVLSDNINLRVQKGELLSQINIEAGRTLIESDKILLSASNTVITGTAWMDGAVIANASIDGAKIQDASIASAKIANLDVDRIVGNTSEFVRASFNGIGESTQIESGFINMIGSNYWRKNIITATGLELFNDVGGTNRAGVIGYFKSRADETQSGEVRVSNTYTGRNRHHIGIGVNTTHDLTLGRNYDGYTTAFRPIISLQGDNGNIKIYNRVMAQNTDFGYELHGDKFYEDYGIGIASLYERFSRIHLTTDVTTLSSAESIHFRTNKGSLAFSANYQGINMQGKTITNQSDIRLKDNIEDSQFNALREIERLRFIEWNWKKDHPRTKEMTDRRQFGIEAQYSPFLQTKGDEDSYLSVDITKQINMNSKGLQELLNKVNKLEEIVNAN